MSDQEVMLNKLHMEMIKYYHGEPHQCQHFCKVHSYAKLIAEQENVDEETLFILETAALTHDIGIRYCMEHYGNANGKLQEKEGPAIADEMLNRLSFDKKVIDRVKYLIGHHHTYSCIDGIDYQILVEADFIVNIFEAKLSEEMIQNTYSSIFKTTTGKAICKQMFM